MNACAPQVFRFELTDYISLSGRVKKVLFYYKNICMIPREKQITGVNVVFPWNGKYDQRYAGCGTRGKASADNRLF